MVGGHGKIMPCNENVQVLKKKLQAAKYVDFVAKNAFFLHGEKLSYKRCLSRKVSNLK